MNTYTIYVGATPIACVADTDDVYTCYEVAKIIGEHADRSVSLVWDETGEEVAYSDPPEKCFEDEPDDIDDDCGFDPYEGCYTYDC